MSLPRSIEVVLKRLETTAGSWTPFSLLSPSAVSPHTWNLFNTSKQSMDVGWREVYPPFQQMDKPPPEGGADDDSIHPPAHGFSPHKLLGHLTLGAATRSRDEWIYTDEGRERSRT
jgi:hypothetical protein